jgi:hypothetical protein
MISIVSIYRTGLLIVDELVQQTGKLITQCGSTNIWPPDQSN